MTPGLFEHRHRCSRCASDFDCECPTPASSRFCPTCERLPSTQSVRAHVANILRIIDADTPPPAE